jgi:hypothetical protein
VKCLLQWNGDRQSKAILTQACSMTMDHLADLPTPFPPRQRFVGSNNAPPISPLFARSLPSKYTNQHTCSHLPTPMTQGRKTRWRIRFCQRVCYICGRLVKRVEPKFTLLDKFAGLQSMIGLCHPSHRVDDRLW